MKRRKARKRKRRRLSAEAMLRQPVTLGGEHMLPCPFCGSSSVRVMREVRFAVECVRCRARGPMPTEDRIIHAQHAWNTRPTK